MKARFIYESVKHLTPRSKEELDQWEKYKITDEDIARIKKLRTYNKMWDALDDFSFDAKYDWLKQHRKKFEPGKSYFRVRPGIMHDLIIELIKHPELVNEAIKHLTPKSEKEIMDATTGDELVEDGLEQKNFDLIKAGLKKDASIVTTIKRLSNITSSMSRNSVAFNLPREEFYNNAINLFNQLKNEKSAIRRELKGQRATDRIKFAEWCGLDWLEEEIYSLEGDTIEQEYLAQELGAYEEKNPLHILDLIKGAFDPLGEKAFKIDYKVISEYKYEVKLSQNTYLSDEVEDLPTIEYEENEEPIVFSIKIMLDILKNQYDYDFNAKYRNGAEIGYDEGTYTINRKEMGKELRDHLQYFIGDIVEDQFEHFKDDILLLAEKMHTESEPFDDEKYYPQLYTESKKSKKINKINTV